jgi:hypothetical protein
MKERLGQMAGAVGLAALILLGMAGVVMVWAAMAASQAAVRP